MKKLDIAMAALGLFAFFGLLFTVSHKLDVRNQHRLEQAGTVFIESVDADEIPDSIPAPTVDSPRAGPLPPTE